MLRYQPRSYPFVICFLVLSSVAAVALAAQSHAFQAARVPVPKPAPGVSRPKTDRSGFPPVPVFKDIANEVGLTASHISTGEKRYILESMSGGVGLFDCDNDGRLDIVMANGSTVERFAITMSKRPSLSQSNSPTPPLMDSRMYRFSPVEMCEAVSPTSFAISLKTGTGGKPLRSVLGRDTPGAGLGTGTRAAWKA